MEYFVVSQKAAKTIIQLATTKCVSITNLILFFWLMGTLTWHCALYLVPLCICKSDNDGFAAVMLFCHVNQCRLLKWLLTVCCNTRRMV